jgi:hypothetical protein
MLADRPLGDPQPRADLLVRPAVHDERQHLGLTTGRHVLLGHGAQPRQDRRPRRRLECQVADRVVEGAPERERLRDDPLQLSEVRDLVVVEVTLDPVQADERQLVRPGDEGGPEGIPPLVHPVNVPELLGAPEPREIEDVAHAQGLADPDPAEGEDARRLGCELLGPLHPRRAQGRHPADGEPDLDGTLVVRGDV